MQGYLSTIYRDSLRRLDAHLLTARQMAALPNILLWDVLALGKAAVPMAQAAQEILGSKISRAFLLTKDNHISTESRQVLQKSFLLREAGHPVPNLAGLEASLELIHWLKQESAAKGLLVLLSGGTSSLLVCPNPPLKLEDLQTLNRMLLASGLPIEKMNVLRKHISQVKGGQLGQIASQHYSQIQQFVMVDICAPKLSPETVLSLVGSGPFMGDESTGDDAQLILESLQPNMNRELFSRLSQALRETPHSSPCHSVVLADHQSLHNMACKLLAHHNAEHPDWNPIVLGEIEQVLETFASFAQNQLRDESKAVYVASGEPTITLPEKTQGKGGRCQELALRFSQRIAGSPGVTFLAASSDGTDGPTDYAGAVVDGQTWPRLCLSLGEAKLLQMLAQHDSSRVLESIPETLIRTGPTGQNLNDLYLLAIH